METGPFEPSIRKDAKADAALPIRASLAVPVITVIHHL